jgi:hypothetical protein
MSFRITQRCTTRRASIKEFVNALRAFLRKDPLYPEADNPQRNNRLTLSQEEVDMRRFYRSPFEEPKWMRTTS